MPLGETGFTDRVVDFAVASQIIFARYANQKVAEANAILESGDKEIIGILTTLKYPAKTALVMTAVRVIMEKVHSKLIQFVQETADEVALTAKDIEVDLFKLQAVGKQIPRGTNEPSKVDVLALIRATPHQGATIKEWFSEFARADAMRAERLLRQAFIERRKPEPILNALLGTYAHGPKNHQAVRSIAQRALRSLVTTMVSHAFAVGRESVWQKNSKRVFREVWISVLDTKTSPFCIAHAGRSWPLGKGPHAPAHIHCRSMKIPLFYKEKLPTNLSWYDWLKNQDAATQLEALGPSRYKLWKEGGVAPERFTDAEGERYTLNELRQRLPQAFKRLSHDHRSVGSV